MPDAFNDPALSRCEKTELRGMAPAALAEALDAIAMSEGKDRNTYVVEVLTAHVRTYLDQVSVVTNVLRGNPLFTEAQRNHGAQTE